MKRVEVEWTDSALVLAGWHNAEDAERALEKIWMGCRTTGYLIRDTPEYVVIALSVGDGGHVADGIAIPRFAIQKITEWPEPKKPQR